MYSYNQPSEKKLPRDITVKGFDWGLHGVNWTKSEPAQILVTVFIKLNDKDNVMEFKIPTPASWSEESINKELLKLPAFKGSKKL